MPPLTKLEAGTAAHLAAILPLLSAADQAGFAEHGGPARALAASTRCWCGVVDTTPLFFGGLLPDGIAWMLATDAVRHNPRFYLQATRQMCREMAALAPRLVVFEDANHAAPLRWLRWLGFTIGPPVAALGHDICVAIRTS